MKLNLGARTTKIPGFKNVDIKKMPGVDIVADISMLPLRDNTVDEIYASHCLEHFSHTMTVDVLKEWYRVLKKAGKLELAVPNFDQAIKVYLTTGMLTDWLRNFLWGDQIYREAYHYTCFTKPTLMECLSEAGFTKMKAIESMPYGLMDCSTLSINGIPLSLNMEAIK
jgi:predicted SAM-dependent methyltransferase